MSWDGGVVGGEGGCCWGFSGIMDGEVKKKDVGDGFGDTQCIHGGLEC